MITAKQMVEKVVGEVRPVNRAVLHLIRVR